MKEKPTAAKATIREWLGLGILGLTSLVVAIDLFVMLLALPTITATLHASATQTLWITDAYGFLLAGFLVTMGTLGDRIGRRKVLMIGSAAFALSSVLVAFAPSAMLLILARGLLGIAGAMIAPAALSLIRHMFADPGQNARAIGIMLSCMIGGSVVGPLVGGVLLEHFWWGSVFLVGIPPMILALLFGKKLLPEYKNPNAQKLHVPSVLLSLAAIIPFIYGVKELAAYGWHWTAAFALALGIAFAIAFVKQQKKLADPLVDMSLFKKPIFTILLVAMLVNTLLPGGVMVLTTQYLQLVAGFSPLEAGLWMIPSAAASIIGFLVAPKLGQTIRPSILIPAGIGFSVLGMLILCFTSVGGSIAPLIIGFALFNLGAGPLVTLGTGIVIGSVAPEKAGSAAAISQTGNEFGFALGVATVGSLATAIYHLGTQKLPAQLSADTSGAIRDSLASAVHTASTLPQTLHDTILFTTRSAFVDAYHVVALVSAVVMTAVAVVIAVKLKKLPAFGAASEAE